MLFPILGPSSLSVVVAQPDERHANRTASVLEWYDRHRTYTPGSNEEDHNYDQLYSSELSSFLNLYFFVVILSPISFINKIKL